jgi:predicted DsbA family dithiol-disulfide isomerase
LTQLPSDCPVTFTTKYMPYQLYPEASEEGEDKFAWYKKSRYGDSDEKMKMYMNLMGSYGHAEGIDFKFGGTVANTLQAHRLIQHYQEAKGPETADNIVKSLYKQYFEEEKHPASDETLLRAATEAGIDEKEAKDFIEDRREGLMEVKALIRDQVGNQVDSVPRIKIEGKRRDVELEGAKEVEEYVAALNKVIRESS